MTVEIQLWPDKYPTERFANGADWSGLLDGDTIISCDAEVEQGDVVIDTPSPVNNFSGAIQTVWMVGGTEGACVIRCDIVTGDGRRFSQKYRFSVIL